jgi:Mg-chelatase subunit ChlD
MRTGTLAIFAVGWLIAACGGGGDSGASSAVNGPARSSSAGGGANDFGNAPQGAASAGRAAPAAGATGSTAQGRLCEVVHLDARPSTPDMLIVLDRSGSMGVEGRWQPSVSAVRSIVDGLASQIRFGLALFPDQTLTGGSSVQVDASPCLTDPDPIGCLANLLVDAGVSVNINNGNGGTCAPGKIVVPVALDNAAAIGGVLDMTVPNGGTPTGETLQGLVEQFAAPSNDPDVVPAAKYVLLVTDGQPTCPAGGGSLTTQPDIDASNAAVEALTARGVHTYVIGYNTSGPGNEAVAAVLDGFATRGGTGDAKHRAVEDEQSLRSELQRIAGVAISCTFLLDKAPPRADYVLVRVDGMQVNLNDPNGWRLVNERTIELTGASCQALQLDGNHAVDAEVRCEAVTPI